MKFPSWDRIRVEFWSRIDTWLDAIPSISKESGRWRITRWGDWGCIYPKIAQNRWTKIVNNCPHENQIRKVEMLGNERWLCDVCPNCSTAHTIELLDKLEL